MDLQKLTDLELMRSLYKELVAEGAIDPLGIITNYLMNGKIRTLYFFDRDATKWDVYSSVKQEVLHRSRQQLLKAALENSLVV